MPPPRPYRGRQRAEATEQTRGRILEAARGLLTGPEGIAAFSIDAVAREAGVARMTVYYQFESRAGLLDALFEELALRGKIRENMEAAFTQPDAWRGLDMLFTAIGVLYETNRDVFVQLQGQVAGDPDLSQGSAARQERRRQSITAMLERLQRQHGVPRPEKFDETVDVLFALTSMGMYDDLARPERTREQICAILSRLARAAIET